jgi:hypothetical protein
MAVEMRRFVAATWVWSPPRVKVLMDYQPRWELGFAAAAAQQAAFVSASASTAQLQHSSQQQQRAAAAALTLQDHCCVHLLTNTLNKVATPFQQSIQAGSSQRQVHLTLQPV